MKNNTKNACRINLVHFLLFFSIYFEVKKTTDFLCVFFFDFSLIKPFFLIPDPEGATIELSHLDTRTHKPNSIQSTIVMFFDQIN